jgi:hypothetical protein
MSSDARRHAPDAPERASVSPDSEGVATTIADLEGTEGIQTHHLAEALQYRARVLDM